MIARIFVEESACGECRCERPADHAVGAESAGAGVLTDCEADFARAFDRRFEWRHTFLNVLIDVLDHKDGVVDDETDGDRQRH